MDFNKKLLNTILSLAIVAGIGDYALYKKFEHTLNPIQEVVRWPYNGTWAEVDTLSKEYVSLKERPLKIIDGRITSLEGIDGYTSQCGRYSIKRDSINFIELDDKRKFAYVGDFFAGKSDDVELTVLSSQDIAEAQEFLRRVNKFRIKHPMFLYTVRDNEDIITQRANISKAIENIPQIKLEELDGLVEGYSILKDH